MTDPEFGLNKEALFRIRTVLSEFPQIEQAILYGSRAMGRQRPGSDIDLTLIGADLDQRVQDKLSWQLDDLLLPWQFDLSIHHHIDNSDLLAHIDRVGKVLYQKPEG